MGCCDVHASGSATGVQYINENKVRCFKHLLERISIAGECFWLWLSLTRDKQMPYAKEHEKKHRKEESLLPSSFQNCGI